MKNNILKTQKNPTCQQTDFLDLLDNKSTPVPEQSLNLPKAEKSESFRRVLPRNQQAGFRNEYNQAMITLYVIGALFASETERQYMPEGLKHEREKAQKTQIRYERYMPKASQNIIHYGRDVVDAYMSADHDYLISLQEEARRSKYPDKRRICSFAIKTVDRIADTIRMYNEII